jgi:hypothetical protein
MKELNVTDSMNLAHNLFIHASNHHWFLSESQYKIIMHLNKNIALKGTDQEKIDYCLMIHQAYRNALNSQYSSLHANLEIHFRTKCKPLLDNLSSFISKHNTTQGFVNVTPCAKA